MTGSWWRDDAWKSNQEIQERKVEKTDKDSVKRQPWTCEKDSHRLQKGSRRPRSSRQDQMTIARDRWEEDGCKLSAGECLNPEGVSFHQGQQKTAV